MRLPTTPYPPAMRMACPLICCSRPVCLLVLRRPSDSSLRPDRFPPTVRAARGHSTDLQLAVTDRRGRSLNARARQPASRQWLPAADCHAAVTADPTHDPGGV